MIKLVDVGIGNIVSVQNWLRRNNISLNVVTEDKSWTVNDTIILPGVGNSVNFTAQLLEWPNLTNLLISGEYRKLVAICGGFQSLCTKVLEGNDENVGLGLIDAVSRPFPNSIYNTGWFEVKTVYKHLPHCKGLRRAVYFNHGCAVYPSDPDGAFIYDESQSYAIGFFTSKMNLMQFHPEKSGYFGDLIARDIFDD